MADVTIKQGDTWPALVVSLVDANGPVDLTTATSITLRMTSKATGVVSRTCTKDPDQVGKRGQASYAWQAADVATPTTYTAEFEVDWGSTHIQTFPNVGFKTIEVVADVR